MHSTPAVQNSICVIQGTPPCRKSTPTMETQNLHFQIHSAILSSLPLGAGFAVHLLPLLILGPCSEDKISQKQ